MFCRKQSTFALAWPKVKVAAQAQHRRVEVIETARKLIKAARSRNIGMPEIREQGVEEALRCKSLVRSVPTIDQHAEASEALD